MSSDSQGTGHLGVLTLLPESETVSEPSVFKLSPEIVLLLGILGTSGGNVFVNGNISTTLEKLRADIQATQGTLTEYGRKIDDHASQLLQLNARVREHDDLLRAYYRPAERRAPTGPGR